MSRPSFVVHHAGPQTTFQDLGRPGYGSLGVSASGAADRASLRLANRLVGNRAGSAALEVTLGPVVVESQSHLLVAVTGALSALSVNGVGAANNAPFALFPGDVLRIPAPLVGLRSYVAVRGGFVVERILGSASYDVLGGIGPPPIRDGDRLRCGDPAGAAEITTDWAPVKGGSDHCELAVVRGPDSPDASDARFFALLQRSWLVSAESNRVGVRLTGAALTSPTTPQASSASRPVLRGAVQLPPDGQPVIFGPDHPTTGGYDVIAVVIDSCLDRTGQARPGDRVSFRAADPARAATQPSRRST